MTMKGIIQVPKTSAYSKYKGYTFDITDIKSYPKPIIIIRLNNGFTTTFSFTEILIVNIYTEFQNHYNAFNCGSSWNRYRELEEYIPGKWDKET